MNELKMFNEKMLEQGYSPKTIQVYTNHIKRFMTTTSKPYTDKKIQNYTNSLVDVTSNYQNQVVSALKKYFYNVYDRNISVERRRLECNEPSIMSNKELEKLLSVKMSIRLRLVIHFAYYSGLRVREIASIKWEHINTREPSIALEDRDTLLHEDTKKLLKRLKKSNRLTIYVFPGLRAGQHISVRTLQKEFSALLMRTKILRGYQLNHLRQSFASHLLNKGIGIEAVSYLLGHQSVKTTERYLRKSEMSIKHIKKMLL